MWLSVLYSSYLFSKVFVCGFRLYFWVFQTNIPIFVCFFAFVQHQHMFLYLCFQITIRLFCFYYPCLCNWASLSVRFVLFSLFLYIVWGVVACGDVVQQCSCSFLMVHVHLLAGCQCEWAIRLQSFPASPSPDAPTGSRSFCLLALAKATGWSIPSAHRVATANQLLFYRNAW